ncbi:P-loop containing nucleoside triphosphate hydrolase protein [Roridomyces roridus]|uniref:P-loop containing nucleoside triphosphate hydrolase protein n=1 Tax=Roridomyces roridus TaxID=1738132 RepID=A0AAD7BXF2_9AGAR|nr:P-loop containing nucleoside triphosphate hydrolase protein [Roridomyces roridus]
MEGMASPFSLKNYLAYGTLGVSIRPNAPARNPLQMPTLAEDGWNAFDEDLLVQTLAETGEDAPLLSEIAFLVQEKFIYASYWLKGDTIIIRVYLIPYDLPGAGGHLTIRQRSEKILRDARCYLIRLLPRLSRSIESWQANNLPEPPSPPPGKDLSEIYESLPSPQPRTTATSFPVMHRLLDFADDLDDLGLRSKLYRYQRESVAAMLQKEMDPQVLDPLFFPVVGLDDKQMFLQPGTMEFLLERPRVDWGRGGILCEELGTGKTVITLALILSTLHQLSEPEHSAIEVLRPVLTPLSFRHFRPELPPEIEKDIEKNSKPRPQSKSKPKFLSKSKPKSQSKSKSQSQPEPQPKPGPRVPRLVELLLHKLATKPMECLSKSADLWEDLEKLEHYTGPRADNIPFYLGRAAKPVDNAPEGQKRSNTQKALETQLLYLTSATLVIVPQNLLLQWKNECLRHCEQLRVLSLDTKVAMPSARELATKYDLILIPIHLFAATKDNGNSKWERCKCDEYSDTIRVPKCVCKPPDCSPLRQIRWKRLVIDEGHVSASLTTNLTFFVNSLSVERRWIVTGTPTTNLLGLNLGKNLAPEFDDERLEGVEEVNSPDEELGSYDEDKVSPPRIWNKHDAQDLTQLGNMIAHFLGVRQLLANGGSVIKTHLKDALLDKNGPRIGAVEILQQLMASVMIRHQISAVEEEVDLPPVNSELVLLDLDPLSIKSYNALQATIAMNAVTSGRKDQDYMFHAQNVGFLQLTIVNMSQLMFWTVDDNFYNAKSQLEDAAKTREKLSPSTSAEDLQLFEEALKHLQLAYADPLWKTLQEHVDVPYRVHNLSKPIFDAWTRTPHTVEGAGPTFAGYMHVDRLRTLREKVLERPLIAEQALVESGKSNARLEEELLKGQKGNRGEASGGQGDGDGDGEQGKSKSGKNKGAESSRSLKANILKAKEATKRAAEPAAIKEMQAELELVAQQNAGLDAVRSENRPSALLASSHIGSTRIGHSASSKLNCIVNEVLRYSDEKFLIFSESELTLAHTSDALQLVGVDFLRFSSQIPPDKRAQSVLTFETSPKYRVFLMELKHGARGLNLISASRVIFCEPVWRADVESQAIKRCHRIGQKRERISVKTLAIQGTAEQAMAERRLVLKDKALKMLQEKGMRDFIANPKFLTHVPTNLPVVDVPFVKLAVPENEEADVLMPDVFTDLPFELPPAPPPIQLQLPEASPSRPATPKRPRLVFEEFISQPPPKRLRQQFSEEQGSAVLVPAPNSPPMASASKPRARVVRFA